MIPLVLAQLTQQLTDAGMVVTTLDDPLQFWTFLAHNRPDLVILDIEMPHLEGVELCQMVRRDRQWAQLPILFLTSREGPSTRQRVYAAGADDYIPKPLEPGLFDHPHSQSSAAATNGLHRPLGARSPWAPWPRPKRSIPFSEICLWPNAIASPIASRYCASSRQRLLKRPHHGHREWYRVCRASYVGKTSCCKWIPIPSY
jgi:CheY-like chemotaxis protein